jgi:hypothetical protein
MVLPLLAASDYGIMVGIGVLLLLFLLVAWVIVQGTRSQLAWRALVDAGDVNAIQTLVGEEVTRWKTAKMPKGVSPGLWHGVQSAELVEVKPEGVRVVATAEGQYALVDGTRREVTSALDEAFALTARLADMVMYDIPNVKLPYVQVDIYSTFRDESGAGQRCIMSTLCERDTADHIDWDEMSGQEVVRAFGGRYSLDDHGHPNAIDPDAPVSGVPAVFYKD